MSVLNELTPADRRAGGVKLMVGELLNAPAFLADNAEDAADLDAIREAIDRIGGGDERVHLLGSGLRRRGACVASADVAKGKQANPRTQ